MVAPLSVLQCCKEARGLFQVEPQTSNGISSNNCQFPSMLCYLQNFIGIITSQIIIIIDQIYSNCNKRRFSRSGAYNTENNKLRIFRSALFILLFSTSISFMKYLHTCYIMFVANNTSRSLTRIFTRQLLSLGKGVGNNNNNNLFIHRAVGKMCNLSYKIYSLESISLEKYLIVEKSFFERLRSTSSEAR